MTKFRRKFRRQWKAFKGAPAGRRFQEQYRRSRRQRDKGSVWVRPLRWLIALVCFAIGVVLVFIPGPAIVFFAIAGLLAASDSRSIARALDWTEVKLRVVLAWAKHRWKAMGVAAKTATVLVAAVLTVGTLAGMWLLWQKR